MSMLMVLPQIICQCGEDSPGEPPVEIDYLTWDDGEHLLRAMTPDGPVWKSVCGNIQWGRPKPFTVNSGVMGGRKVVSGASAGRDFQMSLAVETEADLQELENILSQPLVLVSPADALPGWAAPISDTITIVKIDEVRTLTIQMIGTGPEPEPEFGD